MATNSYKNSKGIRLEKNLLRSNAFRSMSKWSILVYLDFLRKRKYSQVRRKGNMDWIFTNDGEIVYPYLEAERKGIGRREFRNALDELIAKGFLDISHMGIGGRKRIDNNGRVIGDMTTYIISERWKNYGKPTFKPPKIERKKDTRTGRGWAVYNQKQKKHG